MPIITDGVDDSDGSTAPLQLVDKLAIRLGTSLTGADRDRAEAVLTDVVAQLDEFFDPIPVPLTPSVEAVVLAAARRLYLAPQDGVVSETIGEYSYRRESGGHGLFTRDERRALRRAARRASSDTAGDDLSIRVVSERRGRRTDHLWWP